MTKNADALFHNDFSTVLDFWFGDLSDQKKMADDSLTAKRWFASTPEIDLEIVERFGSLHVQLLEAIKGGFMPDAPDHLLAATIVLDQFPRNMFRGTPALFGSDPQALVLSHALVEHPDFSKLDRLHAPFAIMPMMHAENAGQQARMLVLFGGITDAARNAGSPNLGFFEMSMKAAERHKYIIDRFGRFPHRNGILQRQSTPEETLFLAEPNSSF